MRKFNIEKFKNTLMEEVLSGEEKMNAKVQEDKFQSVMRGYAKLPEYFIKGTEVDYEPANLIFPWKEKTLAVDYLGKLIIFWKDIQDKDAILKYITNRFGINIAEIESSGNILFQQINKLMRSPNSEEYMKLAREIYMYVRNKPESGNLTEDDEADIKFFAEKLILLSENQMKKLEELLHSDLTPEVKAKELKVFIETNTKELLINPDNPGELWKLNAPDIWDGLMTAARIKNLSTDENKQKRYQSLVTNILEKYALNALKSGEGKDYEKALSLAEFIKPRYERGPNAYSDGLNSRGAYFLLADNNEIIKQIAQYASDNELDTGTKDIINMEPKAAFKSFKELAAAIKKGSITESILIEKESFLPIQRMNDQLDTLHGTIKSGNDKNMLNAVTIAIQLLGDEEIVNIINSTEELHHWYSVLKQSIHEFYTDKLKQEIEKTNAFKLINVILPIFKSNIFDQGEIKLILGDIIRICANALDSESENAPAIRSLLRNMISNENIRRYLNPFDIEKYTRMSKLPDNTEIEIILKIVDIWEKLKLQLINKKTKGVVPIGQNKKVKYMGISYDDIDKMSKLLPIARINPGILKKLIENVIANSAIEEYTEWLPNNSDLIVYVPIEEYAEPDVLSKMFEPIRRALQRIKVNEITSRNSIDETLINKLETKLKNREAGLIEDINKMPTENTEQTEVPHRFGPQNEITPTLAELYMDQGMPEEAAKIYKELLVSDPGNAELQKKLKEAESAI